MDKEKIILDYIDSHKEELYELLSDMLKIDTQNFNSHGLELPGQEWLMDYCKKRGYDAEMYNLTDIPGFTEHSDYMPNRDAENRPNVAVIFKGEDNTKRIMMAAHMDTEVIGDESRWSVGALSGAIKDGKIYGRGAGDDKAGIAAALFAALAFKECGITPPVEVNVTSYTDEEGGGGNGALASCLKHPSDVYINLDAAHLEVWPWTIGGVCGEAIVRRKELSSSSQDVFDSLNVVVQYLKKLGKKMYDQMGETVYKGSDEQHDALRLESVKIDGSLHEIGRLSFGLYSLSSREDINKEFEEMNIDINKEIEQFNCTFDGFNPTTRYFHPLISDSIPAEAKLFGDALEEITGKSTTYAGGCMSDLSLYGKFGGGVAFNSGIFRKFHEYGGAHQIDEYVECEQLLALTKALALFIARYK